MSSSDTPAEHTGRSGASASVRALETDLAGLGARRWLSRSLVLLAVVAIVTIAYIVRRASAPPPMPRYATQKIERRDLAEEVQSTGRIKPLTEVQVGAQVSGRVVQVYADFNSRVKKGDLLAEIDPQLFGEAVNQAQAQHEAAKASVQRAEASLESADTNLKRVQTLRKENLATQAEADQASGTYDVSKAELAAAKAQLDQLRAQVSSAQTTLKYTRIFSPIDGIVIQRAVEPGQTVAASFSAPVLFVIAQDLSKMQVMADIDEADVGKLKEAMDADIVVDAFPGDVFHGKVVQIRYSPNEVQGVVTYSAVIDVENRESKLRPGMTATVTVRTREAKGATAVPNAALRFRPMPPESEPSERPEPPALESVPLHAGQGRIYTIAGGEPGQEQVAQRTVDIGITDGVWTELKNGLKVGDEVVTEQRDRKKKGKFLGLF